MRKSEYTKISIITVIICFLYAISDELHQYFVPGRACRLLDIFIDTSGGAFFCLIYYLYNKYFVKNRGQYDKQE